MSCLIFLHSLLLLLLFLLSLLPSSYTFFKTKTKKTEACQVELLLTPLRLLSFFLASPFHFLPLLPPSNSYPIASSLFSSTCFLYLVMLTSFFVGYCQAIYTKTNLVVYASHDLTSYPPSSSDPVIFHHIFTNHFFLSVSLLLSVLSCSLAFLGLSLSRIHAFYLFGSPCF